MNICREKARRKKWVPNDNDRVCEQHFKPEDITYKVAENSERVWRTLNPYAVPIKPTILPPYSGLSIPEAPQDREKRAARRQNAKVCSNNENMFSSL